MSAITDEGGVASVEAALGRVEISVGKVREEAWVGVDLETVVDVTVR